ncbi:ABC transporter ATP-binding protein [Treponema socranskii]|uniref:ABC transporter, ATP-binding protein n=1 Tax=Treponema socranskii subsp. socranskii VPI DR56BR1116 = ATCC 35536 TaxID=1125725 RepID=U1GS40_TRESO|nr:ABC transporter ATP-binding protein [Treponema socranskii]ERF60780.1 ABC transporter, ATP-binding protein [Treponema socranskii subsp. socranskii VPI DR56BR1116 = ATCC 35536]MDR9859185.1 ABC transporter ATP-binding protein [Treponema socranskii]
MSKIVLTGINKYYGTNRVLKDVDLTIEDGEFMTLLGPSGCGKTTTLRVIAGLEKPQSGSIVMDGERIVNAAESFFAPPAKRGLNLVFQSYALWPHMTVFDNVAFGLRVKHTPKDEIKKLVENALSRMQIGEYAGRYPSELSGGQQQRVAIARAIATPVELLLLDEPLSNLDAKLRVDMRSELKRLHEEMGTTIIYVTHDQVEALTLSTRIAVFFNGHIEQVASPMSLYQNPASVRIAEFIGNPKINLTGGKAKRTEAGLEVESAFGNFTFQKSDCTDKIPDGTFDCRIGFRPEEVTVSRTASKGAVECRVYSSMPAGSETLIRLSVAGESFLAKRLGIRHYKADETVYAAIAPEKINVFDASSGVLVKKSVEGESD